MKFLFTLATLNVNTYWLMGISSWFVILTASSYLLSLFLDNFITTGTCWVTPLWTKIKWESRHTFTLVYFVHISLFVKK